MKLTTVLLTLFCVSASAFGVNPSRSVVKKAGPVLPSAFRKDQAAASPLFREPTVTRGGAVPGWAAYNDSLDKHPLTAKAFTSLVGWALGDLLAQVRAEYELETKDRTGDCPCHSAYYCSTSNVRSTSCAPLTSRAMEDVNENYELDIGHEYIRNTPPLHISRRHLPFYLFVSHHRFFLAQTPLTGSVSLRFPSLVSSTMDLLDTSFTTGSTARLRVRMPWLSFPRWPLTRFSGAPFS